MPGLLVKGCLLSGSQFCRRTAISGEHTRQRIKHRQSYLFSFARPDKLDYYRILKILGKNLLLDRSLCCIVSCSVFKVFCFAVSSAVCKGPSRGSLSERSFVEDRDELSDNLRRQSAK